MPPAACTKSKTACASGQMQAKWNSAAQTWLEGVFSRGDRRLAPVLLAAHRLGCRLDAWSEHLRLEPWRQAFQETGVDPDFYLRERHPDEVLPWDHLDSGVSRDFLLAERERAFQGLETPDCRRDGCQDCGVCDQDQIDLRLESPPAARRSRAAVAARSCRRRCGYRLTYAKLDEARWLGHLELVAALYRSLRRSGLPLVFSAGFHPLPRVSFHGALPVGVESLAETLDVELAANIGPRGPGGHPQPGLAPGPEGSGGRPPAQAAAPAPLGNGGLPGGKPGARLSAELAADFLAREDFSVTRRRPRKEDRTMDLRPVVARLEVPDPRHLELHLRLRERDNLKVTEPWRISST